MANDPCHVCLPMNPCLSYRTEKGAFFTLASTAIRNRLIDYARKEQRHKSLLSLDLPSSQDDSRSLGEQLPDRSDKMNEVLQITAARTEIEEFSSTELARAYTVRSIADNCTPDRSEPWMPALACWIMRNPTLAAFGPDDSQQKTASGSAGCRFWNRAENPGTAPEISRCHSSGLHQWF